MISVISFAATSGAWAQQAANVVLEKDDAGHWTLVVNGEDYLIRGVDYRVTRVGESPDQGTLKDWMTYDTNHNGHCDAAYDAWWDKNRDNRRDPNEPVLGDFELMRRMGVNTIRWYVNDFKNQKVDKELLRDLFETYGIRVAVGDKFGAYTIGSGASWSLGTDYRDAAQRARMLQSVENMVLEHKNEPYTLLWLLGNENNLHFTNTNAGKYPDDYAAFLEEAAQLIHRLDGRHPVALVNGDTQYIRKYAEKCPSIDIFGTNCYRGENGFGGLWKDVKSHIDKPVLITEFGGAEGNGYDEDWQAKYHENAWKDIEANKAGSGEGNAIGGFAYEWIDEWWKAGDPLRQAPHGTSGKQGVSAKAPWTQEYCGIVSQGNGSKSPLVRQLRKVYFTYQRLWKRAD